MRNKWLITLVGLTIAFAAITGGSFALAGEGTDAPDVGEPSGDGRLVTSIDDIDPNECNWIHNITACDDTQLLDRFLDGEDAIGPDISIGEPYPMPTEDKPCVPMAVVTVTSEGELSCLDLAPDGDDQGQVSPASPPVIEPVR